VDATSPRYHALIQLLRTAEDLWNASRVFFSRWDLSPSQFNVLNVLFTRPDGLSQSDLSRLLIMHRSNATGLIDRLEKRKLVHRAEDPADRRAYVVRLSPLGSQLVEQILPHYFAAANEVWKGVPDRRVEEWMGELQALALSAATVAGSQGASPPAPPNSPPRSRSSKRKKPGPRPAAPGAELRTSDL
jgi:MarR family 2-MHQ and catechol resistance regulon transcriptional repressor